jgi:hypothetical protein
MKTDKHIGLSLPRIRKPMLFKEMIALAGNVGQQNDGVEDADNGFKC